MRVKAKLSLSYFSGWYPHLRHSFKEVSRPASKRSTSVLEDEGYPTFVPTENPQTIEQEGILKTL